MKLALLFLCLVAIVHPLVAAEAVNPAAGSAEPLPGYRLAPGDLLKIEVYDHLDLTMQVRIPDSGVINYPLIGEVRLMVGRTVEEVITELRRRLENDYLRRAEVSAVILEYGPRREKVFVLGHVRNPNAIPWNKDDQLTVSRAISMSGGFDTAARRDQVSLVRDGEAQLVDIDAVLAGRPGAIDPLLKPGDQVLVPTQDRIYIMGRVRLVGAYSLPAGERLTVSKAVVIAGGFTEFVREDQVQLVRAGKVTVVNVRSVVAGKGGVDPELEAGDTVMVPESRL